MFPMRRPPFPPRGDPDRRPPPTPTLREMQMQAAHRGRGPGGWQAGGSVGRNVMNPRAAGAARSRAYKDWMAFNNPLAPTGPGGTGQLQGPVNYPPPGGWSHGGGVGVGPGLPMNVIDASTPAGRRKARALGQYIGPIGVARTMSGEARERAANQARLLSRSPGGWNIGGAVGRLPPILGKGYGPYINPPARFARGFAQGDLVEINKMREAINQLDPTIAIPYEGEDDPRWKWNQKQQLMAERDRLQQLLQTADEAMAQEIMAQIMEINKELEMAAAPGMAGGGIASLRGGGRPVDTRYAAYEARRRNRPPPQIGRALTPMGLNPSGFPYDPANQPLVARPIGPGGG